MSSTRSRFRPAPATENEAWRRAALVLVAHGTGEGGNAALKRHVSALEARHLFAEVAGATLTGGPDPDKILDAIQAPESYVVPFFMTDGTAVRDILHRRLGLTGPVTERGGRRIVLSAPVGLNPRLSKLIVRRAQALARERAITPETATLLLVGHGSTRNPASRRTTEAHATRARKGDIFAAVATAYLDEQPTLDQSVASLVGPAVAVGLFSEDGLHASQDVPPILAARKPAVPYLGAIGSDPEMADLIIDQVKAADA
jgi:sirohydrochlorin cobaltochelatase